MTLLTPNMFRRPEEPIEPQQIDYESGMQYEADWHKWKKDHDHWKFITGLKPEPEWIYAKDSSEYPASLQWIYLKNRIREGKIAVRWQGNKSFKKEIIWADKSTYDKTLKEWQDGQIRFEGYNYQNNCFVNEQEDICVRFDGKATTILGPGFHCDFENGCPVDLFEKLLEIKER